MKQVRKVFTFVMLALLVVAVAGLAGNASAREPLQGSPQQALVLAGGESTNPRVYDPATT